MSTSYKFLFLAFLSASLLFTACGDDDTFIPQDEELITTFSMVFQPTSGGNERAVTFFDEDGEGGQEPSIGTLLLDANTEYSGTISMINQSANPVEVIDLEIKEEDEEHQLFYAIANGLNLTVDYQDQDSDGNPLGLSILLTTGDASTGDLTVTLRHEPNKNAAGVADGDITNAGGETDIEIVFPVEIQ